MGYSADHDSKPTEFHMRLLADPEFDFSPFWDEAVVNWLHRNSGRLLKANPRCCRFYIGDRDQRHNIAQFIPLDNENDIVDFIRTLVAGDSVPIYNLAVRLAAAGKADLIVKVKPELLCTLESNGPGAGIDLTKVIPTMSDASILSLLEDIEWAECRWDETAIAAVLKRLPPERLKDFPLEVLRPRMKWRARRTDTPIHRIRNRTACLLASTLPKDDLHGFIERIARLFGPLECMNCGEFTAQSKPGYTLHRKACDPNNMFINALIIAAERLA